MASKLFLWKILLSNSWKRSDTRPIGRRLGSIVRQLLVIILITFGFIIYRINAPLDAGSQLFGPNEDSNDKNLQVPTLVGRRRVQRVDSAISQSKAGIDDPTAVVVFAAKRPAAIRNHLEQLLKYRPSVERFPVIISQDGVHEETTTVIQEFANVTGKVMFIHHKERTGMGSPAQKSARGYFFIAQHYKWALDKVFLEMNYSHAIITEDDLDIAEDFFSYFSATRKLLSSDPTIWCISAWNDNGANELTDRNRVEQLYRTDFFPGLGWMLTAQLWKELSPKWPEAYWDDWLRRQDIRQNRVCIRPEVSRTAHNNKVAGKGSSGGLYKKYLASIHLPESPIDFSLIDLSYLMKSNYDRILKKRIDDTQVISFEDVEKKAMKKDNAYHIVFHNPREYRRLAKAVGLMMDIRSGMPRTAYYGIVTFFISDARVYGIHPNLTIEQDFGLGNSSDIYDDKWDKMTKFLDFEMLYCKPKKYTGKCDPKSPEMIAWFEKKKMSKRLAAWGEMIVN